MKLILINLLISVILSQSLKQNNGVNVDNLSPRILQQSAYKNKKSGLFLVIPQHILDTLPLEIRNKAAKFKSNNISEQNKKIIKNNTANNKDNNVVKKEIQTESIKEPLKTLNPDLFENNVKENLLPLPSITDLNKNKMLNNSPNKNEKMPFDKIPLKSKNNQNKNMINLKKPQVITSEEQENNNGTGFELIPIGMNNQEKIKFQNLFSQILGLGVFNIFDSLINESSKIDLMLVHKTPLNNIGKDLYKIIYTVQNQHYMTGKLYYGVEIAVPIGFFSVKANEVDLISFGKSVFLDNIYQLLKIDKSQISGQINNLKNLNKTRNNKGNDFSQQSKLKIIQTLKNISTLNKNSIQMNNHKQQQNKNRGTYFFPVA